MALPFQPCFSDLAASERLAAAVSSSGLMMLTKQTTTE
jgi:hypothetical protein